MEAEAEANLYRSYEARQAAAWHQRPRLPVCLVVGPLGAGKTQLLKNILKKKGLLRIGAIINDFGEKDVDGATVSSSSRSEVVALPGGCVCCSSTVTGQFREAVSKFLEVPDHADGKLDYLLVETSGVTDPDGIIAALEEEFGKLTRARLDCVVAVVDGDALPRSSQQLSAAVRHHLEEADVVLVNKADLMTDSDESTVASMVEEINALADIHFCCYGDVPLHWVLDVELPERALQAVSHEAIASQAYASATGGNLRKERSNSARGDKVGSGTAEVPSQSHLEKEGMAQITFLPSSLLSLAAFQDWVCEGIPQGTTRSKGYLAFSHSPRDRFLFNLSGRNRTSLEREGKWEGPPSQRLVLIGGKGLKEDGASILSGMKALHELPSSREKAVDEARAIRDAITSDPHFVNMLQGDSGGTMPHSSIVVFRFTGEGVFKLSVTQLHVRYGVDLDSINESILNAVNSRIEGGKRLFLTPLEVDGTLYLAWEAGGGVKLLECWDTLLACTRHVMARELAHVVKCNCIY